MGREWRTGHDEAIEALQWGNPQPTARPRLMPLNHSFTLDLVVGFQQRTDAERFLMEFKERLAKFELEVHPDKTRLIAFGRDAWRNRKRKSQAKLRTFPFLGFTHYCGENSKGLLSGLAEDGEQANEGQAPAAQARAMRSNARAGRCYREVAETGGTRLLPIS